MVVEWAAVRQAIPLLPKIWAYIRRPRLRLYFDASQTYHLRTVSDAGGVLGYFCHVMVRNSGGRVARNCRARLLEVRVRAADGSESPAPGFVAPVPLKWAHELDLGPRDVELDLPRRLDVCYALASSPDLLRFFTHPIQAGVQTIFPPGRHTVRIRVDADDARTAEGIFRIDFMHGWDHIVVAEAVSS